MGISRRKKPATCIRMSSVAAVSCISDSRYVFLSSSPRPVLISVWRDAGVCGFWTYFCTTSATSGGSLESNSEDDDDNVMVAKSLREQRSFDPTRRERTFEVEPPRNILGTTEPTCTLKLLMFVVMMDALVLYEA
mmetsp:Transcript_36957/g.80473  ORF Transcript_36957/g.80473 Transcript_36957/m.80473 type:complete len:135 (+) Transcript_36957:313-717(+)